MDIQTSYAPQAAGLQLGQHHHHHGHLGHLAHLGTHMSLQHQPQHQQQQHQQQHHHHHHHHHHQQQQQLAQSNQHPQAPQAQPQPHQQAPQQTRQPQEAPQQQLHHQQPQHQQQPQQQQQQPRPYMSPTQPFASFYPGFAPHNSLYQIVSQLFPGLVRLTPAPAADVPVHLQPAQPAIPVYPAQSAQQAPQPQAQSQLASQQPTPQLLLPRQPLHQDSPLTRLPAHTPPSQTPQTQAPQQPPQAQQTFQASVPPLAPAPTNIVLPNTQQIQQIFNLLSYQPSIPQVASEAVVAAHQQVAVQQQHHQAPLVQQQAHLANLSPTSRPQGVVAPQPLIAPQPPPTTTTTQQQQTFQPQITSLPRSGLTNNGRPDQQHAIAPTTTIDSTNNSNTSITNASPVCSHLHASVLASQQPPSTMGSQTNSGSAPMPVGPQQQQQIPQMQLIDPLPLIPAPAMQQQQPQQQQQPPQQQQQQTQQQIPIGSPLIYSPFNALNSYSYLFAMLSGHLPPFNSLNLNLIQQLIELGNHNRSLDPHSLANNQANHPSQLAYNAHLQPSHHHHHHHHHGGPNSGQNNGQDDTMLTMNESKPRGLTRVEIDNLHAYVQQNEKDNRICVICLSKFELKSRIRTLSCNHAFHAKCVDKWLRANRTCPICRRDALKSYQSKIKRI